MVSNSSSSSSSSKKRNNDVPASEEGDEVALIRRDYRQVCLEFDRLESEPYKALEFEELMRSFYERHRGYLERVQFVFPREIRELLATANNNNNNNNNNSNNNKGTGKAKSKLLVNDDPISDLHDERLMDESKMNDNLLDDLNVIKSIECKRVSEFELANSLADEQVVGEHTGNNNNNSNHHHHLLLADIFRRMAQACSARVTYQRCRHKLEQDRREPLRWAQVALRHNPNDFKTCYWYMITVGRYSELELAPRDKVLAGEAFKRSCYRCLEMEPNDPLAHHLLGRYYYHIGGLNWIQRTILKGFFNFKVEGSYEEAEREFRRAHAIRDDWMPVGLWMARVLLAKRKSVDDEIRSWIELGLRMEIREPTTEMEREELVELAQKLGIPVPAGPAP